MFLHTDGNVWVSFVVVVAVVYLIFNMFVSIFYQTRTSI